MAKIVPKNALVHGGSAGEADLTSGAPLRDMAASAQQNVQEDLDRHGVSYLVHEQAARLHAVSRLYWDACLAAAQAGDIQKLDQYVSRFGWLAGASLRAWQQVQAEDKKAGPTLDAVLNKGGEDA
jgi:hypothetical protein